MIKSLVAAVALIGAIALTAMPAQAQTYNPNQYGYQAVTFPTNRIVAITNTLTSGNIINCTDSGQIGLLIGAELHTTGTSTSIWTFAASPRGTTNLMTQGAFSPFTIIMTHTDTTPDYFYTNINVGAIGFLTLTTVGQNGTAHVTNHIVHAFNKPGF